MIRKHLAPVTDVVGSAVTELKAIRIGFRAGLIGGDSPLGTVTTVRDLARLGAVSAALVKAARMHPDRTAVIDELGSITYADLNAAANALANHWRELGVGPEHGVAILARNHRFIIMALYATIKIGARVVLLNTDFAGPQIREVSAREGVDLLVHDDEYSAFLEGIEPQFGRFRAWADDATDEPAADTIAAVIAGGNTTPPTPPGQPSRIVVLTSGTTGTPKGAPRAEPKGITPVGALLERAPFRSGDVVEICAPMFHSLGLAFMLLSIAMASTLVVRRRFDPAAVVQSIETNESRAMVLVPVMFSRVLDALEAASPRPDLSSLEVVLLGGSQLGGDLAEQGLRDLGPVLYNLYGSTEVAYATIATPEDLAAEPATVGRPVLGTQVRILDDQGHQVTPGDVGRVFVRNAMPFDGYTGGGSKSVVDGFMATGDVGHFDANGRLFIDGRDDEMIVSGGENVFPREIEELLEHHPSVLEVAVIGAPDDQWGQRLRAFVVPEKGATIDEDAIKEHVRSNLARYKVPRDVVVLDELPRNATGKILKRVLRES